MSEFTVKVHGVVEVQGNMGNYGKKIKEAANQGVIDSAKAIAETAKSICPVKTGRLRDSIDYEFTYSGKKVSAEVYADTEYAGFVEFGTRFMAPRYYMTRAFAQHAPYMPFRVAGEIQREL